VLTATDAKRHTTTYAYQPTGLRNLATVTADGVTTEHRYDGLGRSVRIVAAGTAGDSLA
jgi:YD repeat-containing protein